MIHITTTIHCLSYLWISRFTFTYFLTAGIVGPQQMTSLPVSSIFLCSPLPTALWDLANSRSVHSLLLSSYSFSVCLVFFPLSLCLARCFWPDLVNGRHVHTSAVCVSLRWSGSSCGPIACWILAQTSSLVAWFLNKILSILR